MEWDGLVTAVKQVGARLVKGSGAEGENEAQPADPPMPVSRAIVTTEYDEPLRSYGAASPAVAAPAEPTLAGFKQQQRSLTQRNELMNRHGYLPRCEWRPVLDASCAASHPLICTLYLIFIHCWLRPG